MKVRDAVGDELRKGASSQTQRTPLVRQAEQLILAGYVDIESVRESLRELPISETVMAHVHAGQHVAAIAALCRERSIGLREAKTIVDGLCNSIADATN